MRWGSQRWEPPPPPCGGLRLPCRAGPLRLRCQPGLIGSEAKGGPVRACPRCGLGIRSGPAGGQGLELEGARPGAGETGARGIVKSCDRYESAPHTMRRPPR